MAIQNQEQKKSVRAHQDVQEVSTESDKIQKRYLSQSKSLPALIINNGLGQALAFLFSKQKKEKADGILLRHISSWVVDRLAPGTPKEQKKNLLEHFYNNQNGWGYEEIMLATSEALSYLQWNRRYGEALLKEED